VDLNIEELMHQVVKIIRCIASVIVICGFTTRKHGFSNGIFLGDISVANCDGNPGFKYPY